MSEQFVAVHIPRVAKLTTGMSAMGSIVSIALSAMLRQFLSRITLPFPRKYTEIVNAQVAIVKLVVSTHVLFELVEVSERRSVAEFACVLEESIIGTLDEMHFELDTELAVLELLVWVPCLETGFDPTERFDVLAEKYLKRYMSGLVVERRSYVP